MKRCSKCKEILTNESFYKNKNDTLRRSQNE